MDPSVFSRAVNLLLALLCLFYVQPVHAQTSNGQARVVVNQGVNITKNADLEFGTFIPGISNSVFRLNQNSGVLNQRSGDAIAVGGTPTRASFTAFGQPLLRVLMTVNQNQIFIVRDGGTETMRVNRFRLDGPRNRFLDASGQATYLVGGQIRIGANQVSGTYRGTFDVTIDYF